MGEKSNSNLEPGYIWAPYIMSQTVDVVFDNSEKIKNEVIIPKNNKVTTTKIVK